jgi:CRISPR-associated protein Csm4
MSDAFPAGLIPRPTAPDAVLGLTADPAERKRSRTHRWVPASRIGQPVHRLMAQRQASEIVKPPVVISQNTINRLTGTTGAGQFAPRQVDRMFFPGGTRLDFYTVLDEGRMSGNDLNCLVQDIGLHGYGRDASTGLGKFKVLATVEQVWSFEESRHWLTLAPCAPEPAVLDADGCYYLPVTRFGRHGNLAVTRGNPFKSPLLMASTGALLKSREPSRWAIHGRGLGGRNNPLSAVVPDAVHQGYAPVIPMVMN